MLTMMMNNTNFSGLNDRVGRSTSADTKLLSELDPEGNSGRHAQSNDPPRPRYILTQNQKQKRKGTSRRVGYYGRPKCEVGTMFASRKECSAAGVHHPTMAGISCTTQKSKDDPDSGAFSIVLNGGYEDDDDMGDVVWYTGSGGQSNSSEQVRRWKYDVKSVVCLHSFSRRLVKTLINPSATTSTTLYDLTN
ncbi:hypothetical protein Ac2012v2_007877 [Leucoagaricus gongylophorus]